MGPTAFSLDAQTMERNTHNNHNGCHPYSTQSHAGRSGLLLPMARDSAMAGPLHPPVSQSLDSPLGWDTSSGRASSPIALDPVGRQLAAVRALNTLQAAILLLTLAWVQGVPGSGPRDYWLVRLLVLVSTFLLSAHLVNVPAEWVQRWVLDSDPRADTDNGAPHPEDRSRSMWSGTSLRPSPSPSSLPSLPMFDSNRAVATHPPPFLAHWRQSLRRLTPLMLALTATATVIDAAYWGAVLVPSLVAQVLAPDPNASGANVSAAVRLFLHIRYLSTVVLTLASLLLGVLISYALWRLWRLLGRSSTSTG